jgi:hypothetical protein
LTLVGKVNGWTHHLFAYTKSADRESITTSRQTAAVTKTRSFPGCRRRTSSHIGKVQTTSPIPPKRQTMTARFRCRAHWKTSHTTKGIHSAPCRLKRKNRRHHGLSAERSGPGKIRSKDCRRLVVANLRNAMISTRPRVSDETYAQSHLLCSHRNSADFSS